MTPCYGTNSVYTKSVQNLGNFEIKHIPERSTWLPWSVFEILKCGGLKIRAKYTVSFGLSLINWSEEGFELICAKSTAF